MVQANSFLQRLVPQILASPAYKDRGLLIVTFDEAEAEPGANADASACCNERPGPNTINPGGPIPGAGGGRIGAVMLSPCIQPSTVSNRPYNHYSLLRSIENNFGLAHLGYAGQSGLQPFNVDILNNPGCPMKGQRKCKKKRRKKHRDHDAAAKKHKQKKCKRTKRPKRRAVT
jgi:phosphatidylinositol-3-phosphatase